MAIVQISRITNRKGLQENLPQLAGAELGWSIDERRLFIGNGTLAEGAPVVGNTEILTEFSDIFEFQSTYTYKGEAAGYTVQTGPTSGTPITQSLQSWLDQYATVKDFGAVGDGVTDDTAAINRALYQLFCRETNPQIRRSLFFPAGVYLVKETIVIPPYATLYGEGQDNSIIFLESGDDSALRAYVARTGDSLQQTGVNIGTNGATAPKFITVMNMGFETQDADVDVFLVEDASNCTFYGVNFQGPLTASGLTVATDNIAGVRFDSTASLICNAITFDCCAFNGLTYGISTEQQIQGITVSNSKFDTLYQGISLGASAPVNGGPTGFRIVHNLFDNIYAQGIIMGNINLNATGHNVFYDVGNHFNGSTNPATTIIDINGNNNVSISDMFERGDAYAVTPTTVRVNINNKLNIATTNGKEMQLGTYTRVSGELVTLVDASGPTTLFTVDTVFTKAFSVNYTIVRESAYRTGTLTVASSTGDSTGDLSYTDDFVENSSTEVTLTVTQSGDDVNVQYTANATGVNGSITYSVNHLA
jgi:hypothetical protein